MFRPFLEQLRQHAVPVTLREYLGFLEALKAGLAQFDAEGFYYLARTTMVKDERHIDRFDRAFAAAFKGLDAITPQAMLEAVDLPAEWLQALAEKHLTEEERAKYRALWQRGLHGACNYYRATPLVPPRAGDPGAEAVQIPEHLCTIPMPTRVLWGADDFALLPGLLDGLEAWIPRLEIRRIAGASHWLVHEQPERVTAELAQFLQEKL